MKKIFGFGFTTKKHGHGFGLHSSVLAAKELGGKLEVFSEGAGKGATFTLTLPRNLLQVQEATHAAEGQPAASNHCH